MASSEKIIQLTVNQYQKLSPEKKVTYQEQMRNSNSEVLKLLGGDNCQKQPSQIHTVIQTSTDVSETKKFHKFISASNLLSVAKTSTSHIVDKIIEENSTGQLFGPSGAGKTFVVLDIGLCVATGIPWNGLPVKRGIVLYLAGEGHGALRRRIKAWMLYHGMTAEDLKLFHISRHVITMSSQDLKDVQDEACSMSEAHGAPVSMIVIDTLARHLDGDENTAKDMSSFIRSIDSLRDSFPGSVALIVHHTGHGEDSQKRSRGSSALRAALDFEIHCHAGLLTFTKMKDAAIPDQIKFKLLPVTVANGDDGEPMTSCAVSYGERELSHKALPFTDIEKTAIMALIKASAKSPLQHDDLIGAHIEVWRQAFYDARRFSDPDVSSEALKKSFQRVPDSLREKSVIIEHEHGQFLTSPDHQAEIVSMIPGHGTKAGHVSVCTGDVQAGHGTHTYKVCPDVPPSGMKIVDLSHCDPNGTWC